MNWKELEPKTLKLREDLLATLKAIQSENRAVNLPEISDNINFAANLLAKPAYYIVICGEVKKGKSTFINALIGKELLPTGVKETTSQVFRISNHPNESYSLKFTDGTQEQINREQLTKFGSQVDADLLGEPVFKNRQLDFIQVNIPIEFLPKGVSIVDTPGLGALYKSHELITQQYIKNAAAVVFVFDPNQPMVQQEKLFLEKVFSVTPYVMFVMTKVDEFNEHTWVTQISRTETLLKDSFGNKCYTMPKVFPFSSKLLLEASEKSDPDAKEESVEFSYFPAAYAELLKVIYRTVGLSRTRFAWHEAGKQKTKVLANIDDQLKILSATTKEEQDKIKEKKTVIRQSFEQMWGPASTKRKEVMQEVQAIITGVQNRAAQLVSTSGMIYKNYLEQIEDLSSMNQVKSFAENASKKIIGEVSTEWLAIVNSSQQDVLAALNVIHAEIEKLSSDDNLTSTNNLQFVELTFGEKFQSYKSKYMDAAITTTVGTTLLGFAGVALAPVFPVLIIGTVLYGLIFGSNDAEKRELDKNKANLKNNLNTIMNEINTQLFIKPVTGGHKSIVQTFVSELSNSVEKAMSTMFEKQKNALENEHKKLDEQARLGTEQRQKELILLNEQRKKWMEIATQVDKEKVLLEEIQKALN